MSMKHTSCIYLHILWVTVHQHDFDICTNHTKYLKMRFQKITFDSTLLLFSFRMRIYMHSYSIASKDMSVSDMQYTKTMIPTCSLYLSCLIIIRLICSIEGGKHPYSPLPAACTHLCCSEKAQQQWSLVTLPLSWLLQASPARVRQHPPRQQSLLH